jgi:predicted HTH domain antitoxin
MTIFGYTWDEIKRAQQGGALARRIPAGIYKQLATEGDWELLERYGEAELRNRGYFGVLDRLENTRLANDMPDCDRSACRDHSLRACDNPDCPSLRPNHCMVTIQQKGKKMTQDEIFEGVEAMIPAELWEKYKHLSFGEMAEIAEMAEFADELRQAETDWFEAGGA